MNALNGIKMAIESDKQVKAFFEHSIDTLTRLRYPALVNFLLNMYMPSTQIIPITAFYI